MLGSLFHAYRNSRVFVLSISQRVSVRVGFVSRPYYGGESQLDKIRPKGFQDIYLIRFLCYQMSDLEFLDDSLFSVELEFLF